jgi:hypothetical protein|tara:strand:+ start:588 stop:734 length:147 start_codon:yes stop_codon:yes gene_type:complete
MKQNDRKFQNRKKQWWKEWLALLAFMALMFAIGIFLGWYHGNLVWTGF